MKRSPFHKLIVTYYLKPLSAKAVAEEINGLMLKNKCAANVDTDMVLAVWRDEFKRNGIWSALERQEGPRPLHGYAETPLIKFLRDHCRSLDEGLAA
jgi:hypothetical protein